MEPKQLTVSPIVVGASTVGMVYKDGVLLCADTLASYGSLRKFKSIHRIAPVGLNTLIASSGEYSDFQETVRILHETALADWVHQDGVVLSAAHYANYLSAILYQRRNKGDPLYNASLVGGMVAGKPYLAYLDLYGLKLEGAWQVSGMASYLCRGILGTEHRPDLTEAEAKALAEKCMRAVFYREARAHDSIQFATITSQGLNIEAPYVFESTWNLQGFQHYSLNPLYP